MGDQGLWIRRTDGGLGIQPTRGLVPRDGARFQGFETGPAFRDRSNLA
jgi:hypothetical protein